jgi:hypothetical protein
MRLEDTLLITLMRNLLKKGDRIWHKGVYGVHQVDKIGETVLDVPASMNRPAYSGPAFDIRLIGSIGITLTPAETDDFDLEKGATDEYGTDWYLVKHSQKRRVQEARVQPLGTPLLIMILQREIGKGHKVLIDFRKDGSRHEGVIYRVVPDSLVSTILYNDDGILDLVLIDNATAEEDATLCKNPTGTLTLTNTSELDEGKADAPIWVDLINMLISKGEKVYTWDGDNHDDDGIVCSINKAVAGSDGLVYLLCTYAKAWAGNGAMAGTNAGEIVCDGDLDDYRFEKIDGIHWLKAPHEA